MINNSGNLHVMTVNIVNSRLGLYSQLYFFFDSHYSHGNCHEARTNNVWMLNEVNGDEVLINLQGIGIMSEGFTYESLRIQPPALDTLIAKP